MNSDVFDLIAIIIMSGILLKEQYKKLKEKDKHDGFIVIELYSVFALVAIFLGSFIALGGAFMEVK